MRSFAAARAAATGQEWLTPARRAYRQIAQIPSQARVLAAFTAARARVSREGLPPRRDAGSFNRLFYRSCERQLAREKRVLETFDPWHYRRLNETRLLGQIVFEYGTLLNSEPQWAGLRVLDLGTGDSGFPNWMVAQGAHVVTLDLPDPAEASSRRRRTGLLGSRRGGSGSINHAVGSMFALAFPADSFDLVTSLSVIEHVDTRFPERSYVPYVEQTQLAARSLSEMIRVTRPGGHLYLTSDCCDYSKATSDAWRQAYYYRDGPALSGAWPVGDVESLFYNFVVAHGCRLVGPKDFSPRDVGGNPEVETFRGKYWSAFSMLAEKTLPPPSNH